MICIGMGRDIKYKTKKEQKLALRERQIRYYSRNREYIKQRNLKSYYVKKINNK